MTILNFLIHKYSNPCRLSNLIPIFALILLILVPSAYSDEVTLSWDPNPEPEIAGYKVYYGMDSRNYEASVDVGIGFSCTISGLQEGKTYYFAVTAYNIENIESDFSEEVDYTIPIGGSPVPGLTVIPQEQMSIVSVDSEELTGEPGAAENAIDGRSDTFWHTEWHYTDPKHPHEIIINLGNSIDVKGFRYLPRQDGRAEGTVADYAFYVSNDGVAWGQPVTEGTFNANTAEKEVTFSGKIGQYIRFVALSEIGGNPWTSMAEINILGNYVRSSAVIPQEQMSMVSVDSEELTGEPGAAENAIDGRGDSFWHTEWHYSDPEHPHEIIIDIGDIYTVKGFRYLPRQDGRAEGTVADYAFYVSNDGVSWGPPVADGTFNSGTAEKEVTFLGKIGQYIRFVALSEIDGNPWTSMAEINIIGSDPN